MGDSRPFGADGSGARHVRASATGQLVAAGIERFEQLMQDTLGRSLATTAKHHQQWSSLQRRITVEVLRAAACRLAEGSDVLFRLRLFDAEFCAVAHGFGAFDAATKPLVARVAKPEELGELLESLLALSAQHQAGKLRFGPSLQRKQRGTFYTPQPVVESVVRAAVAPWIDIARPLPRICDPSLGGGAFLLGAARELLAARMAANGDQAQVRRDITAGLHGFDIEPLAIAVAEAALVFWARIDGTELVRLQRQLRLVDALEVACETTFDLVIGNPPWVAYAGRATQPITAQRRRWLAQHYAAFHGYPTLQACFVELAARLAKRGRVALLVPSPIADLDGYRPLRKVLTRTHRVHSELIEYGQDAFDGVVQPCFGLIADADANACERDAPFALVERSGVAATAARVEPPSCLERLAAFERFPAECFREFGFQTTSEVTRRMLRRGSDATPPFDYPLLEGRDVAEFIVGEPKLHLQADRNELKRLHCRLRELDEFRQVEFLVRQTAKYTIAALHNGLPFRNSLLAGFGVARYSARVLVGLLNSTLIRALHLAAQRDARQKTFPQVKVAHLRGLPAPPERGTYSGELEGLVLAMHGRRPDAGERQRLDDLVYGWYGIASEEASVVERFFLDRTR
jgi:hypothetical protein